MLFIVGFLLTLTLSLTTAVKIQEGSDWANDILEYHNNARRNLADCKQRGFNNQLLPPPRDGYPMLQWSDAMAKSANGYASACTVAKEGSCDHHTPTPNGENIACNTYAPRLMTEEESEKMVTDRMIDIEVARWKYGMYGNSDLNCRKNGNWVSESKGNCGHYTQIIWAKTTLVGCAYQNCNGNDMKKKMTHLVCHYWPSGNLLNERPYDIGGTCDGYGNAVIETAREDCLKISGMPSQKTNGNFWMSSLNGEWWRDPDGHWNKEGGINCGETDCRLSWNTRGKEFRVSFDYKPFGWCKKSNVRSCGGGNWKYERKSDNKATPTPTSVNIQYCEDANNPSPTPRPTPKPTPRPTPKPTKKPTAGNNCLEIAGFPNNLRTYHDKYLNTLNGEWSKRSDGSWKKGSLILSWTAIHRAWWINDGPEHGYCVFSNVFDCDNEWRFVRRSGSATKYSNGVTFSLCGALVSTDYPCYAKHAQTLNFRLNAGSATKYSNGVTFSLCGALVSTDYPCYAKHAQTLNFRLNASHSGLEFERVDVAGCHNDAAQWFASSDKNDTNSTEFVLTAGNATTDEWKWLIHDTGYPYPRYVCNATELYNCGRGKWHQVVMHNHAVNDTYNESYFYPTRANQTLSDWTDSDNGADYEDGYSIYNYLYEYDYMSYDSFLLANASNQSYDLPPAPEAELEYVVLADATLVPIVSAAASGASSVFTRSVVLAVVAVLLFVIVVAVGGYFVLKRSQQRKEVMKQMEVVADDEEVIATTDNMTLMEN
eukprot:CAMPEP_0202730566 /NCGR_PEP_ID=MMETSP1385-20130828/186701_1 /ASSEMBLY_ACC=CAM_ASM_000861 /TAXON_ID=933848 /ORGANISM="Elphidium margaritaceum" /LENGTH=765 /DNA_ID=CAMNT_0049396841 /DNA_START=28 /DNA_END=2325 /DNA_ORIENTATION=-